ncbi:hypothetical protein ACVWYQ_006267 [Bradyrhizobium sp. USDA 3397]
MAQEILEMRTVRSDLVKERSLLGDNEPILVHYLFIPRRPPMPSRVPVRSSASCRGRRQRHDPTRAAYFSDMQDTPEFLAALNHARKRSCHEGRGRMHIEAI